jgi:hypothetical protein
MDTAVLLVYAGDLWKDLLRCRSFGDVSECTNRLTSPAIIGNILLSCLIKVGKRMKEDRPSMPGGSIGIKELALVSR